MIKKIYITIIFFTVICGYSQNSQQWEIHNLMEHLHQVIEVENELWVDGYNGIVRYDKISGEYEVFNEANSGLPDNYIMALAVDSTNVLWVSTLYGGAVSFDGNDWTILDTLNYYSGHYSHIFVDGDNRKWFLGSGELITLDSSGWKLIDIDTLGLSGLSFLDAIIDHEGVIWFGTSDGIVKYSEDETILYSSETSGLPLGYSWSLAEDEQHHIWFLKGANLVDFDRQDFTVYNRNNSGMINHNFYDVDVDEDGRIWMSCATHYYSGYIIGGIQSFDGTSWSKIDTSNSNISSVEVYGLHIDNDDIFWIAGVNGLDRYDGVQVDPVWISNAQLSSNRIEDIGSDKDGRISVATFKGTDQFSWLGWQNLNQFDCEALHVEPDGKLWMANCFEVQTYHNGNISTIETPYAWSTPVEEVRNIIIDSSGVLWMDYPPHYQWLPPPWGGEFRGGGLFVYDGNSWKDLNPGNSPLPDTLVLDMAVDHNNVLWLATPKGIVSIASDKWTIYNSSNSDLPVDYFNTINVDHENNVWTSLPYDGFAYYDGFSWTIIDRPNQQYISRAGDICVDSEGAIWGITINKLMRYYDNEWTDYDRYSTPMPYNELKCLAIDKYDNKYMGTLAQGVVIFNENGVITGIDDSSEERSEIDLSVYPNPADEHIWINVYDECEGAFDVYIYNIQGQKVYETTESVSGKNSRISVDVSSLKPGTYLYRVSGSQFNESGKFVVSIKR